MVKRKEEQLLEQYEKLESANAGLECHVVYLENQLAVEKRNNALMNLMHSDPECRKVMKKFVETLRMEAVEKQAKAEQAAREAGNAKNLANAVSQIFQFEQTDWETMHVKISSPYFAL